MGRKTPPRKQLVSFFPFTPGGTLVALTDLVLGTPALTWFNRELSAFSKCEPSLAASIIHTVMWGLTIISGWQGSRRRLSK